MDFRAGVYGRLQGVCLCLCLYTQEMRNTCHIHVASAVSLARLGNYSRHEGVILGVCCVIVAPTSTPPVSPALLGLSCGCTGPRTSLTGSGLGDKLGPIWN